MTAIRNSYYPTAHYAVCKVIFWSIDKELGYMTAIRNSYYPT